MAALWAASLLALCGGAAGRPVAEQGRHALLRREISPSGEVLPPQPRPADEVAAVALRAAAQGRAAEAAAGGGGSAVDRPGADLFEDAVLSAAEGQGGHGIMCSLLSVACWKRKFNEATATLKKKEKELQRITEQITGESAKREQELRKKAEQQTEELKKQTEELNKQKAAIEEQKKAAEKQKAVAEGQKAAAVREMTVARKHVAAAMKRRFEAEKLVAKTKKAEQNMEKAMMTAIRRSRDAETAARRARVFEAAAAKDRARALEEKHAAKEDAMKIASEKERIQAEVECSNAFRGQTLEEVSVTDRTIRVPNGVSLHMDTVSGQLEAHRCPNPSACPSVTVVGSATMTNDPSITCKIRFNKVFDCAPGYNDTGLGCASCAFGFGRSTSDPFRCMKCGSGSVYLQLAGYVGQPAVMFALSVQSAWKVGTSSTIAATSERELLKILISYCGTSALLGSVLLTVPFVEDLSDRAKTLLGTLIKTAEAGNPTMSSSLDCFLEVAGMPPFPPNIAALATLAIPGVIMSCALVGACFLKCRRGVALKSSMLLCVVVAGNQFIPDIAGTTAQAFPVFHTQKSGQRDAQWMMSWAPWLRDSDRFRMVLLTTPILLAAIAAGPVLWMTMTLRLSGARGPPGSGEGEAAESDSGEGEVAGDGSGEEIQPAGSRAPGAASETQGTNAGASAASSGSQEPAQEPQEQRSLAVSSAVAYLAGSYRAGCAWWWEAFRLTKNMLLAFVCRASPMTYSASGLLSQIGMVLIFFLAAHCYFQPYTDPKLNAIEAFAVSAMVIVVMATSFLIAGSWSVIPQTEALVLVLTALTMIATFLILFLMYARAKLHGQPAGAEDEQKTRAGARPSRSGRSSERGVTRTARRGGQEQEVPVGEDGGLDGGPRPGGRQAAELAEAPVPGEPRG